MVDKVSNSCGRPLKDGVESELILRCDSMFGCIHACRTAQCLTRFKRAARCTTPWRFNLLLCCHNVLVEEEGQPVLVPSRRRKLSSADYTILHRVFEGRMTLGICSRRLELCRDCQQQAATERLQSQLFNRRGQETVASLYYAAIYVRSGRLDYAQYGWMGLPCGMKMHLRVARITVSTAADEMQSPHVCHAPVTTSIFRPWEVVLA